MYVQLLRQGQQLEDPEAEMMVALPPQEEYQGDQEPHSLTVHQDQEDLIPQAQEVQVHPRGILLVADVG